jgi:hypothetical protein
VDEQRHVCVSDVVYLVSQVGHILSRLRELLGFPQPPGAYCTSATRRPACGQRCRALSTSPRCSSPSAQRTYLLAGVPGAPADFAAGTRGKLAITVN